MLLLFPTVVRGETLHKFTTYNLIHDVCRVFAFHSTLSISHIHTLIHFPISFFTPYTVNITSTTHFDTRQNTPHDSHSQDTTFVLSHRHKMSASTPTKTPTKDEEGIMTCLICMCLMKCVFVASLFSVFSLSFLREKEEEQGQECTAANNRALHFLKEIILQRRKGNSYLQRWCSRRTTILSCWGKWSQEYTLWQYGRGHQGKRTWHPWMHPRG